MCISKFFYLIEKIWTKFSHAFEIFCVALITQYFVLNTRYNILLQKKEKKSDNTFFLKIKTQRDVGYELTI